MTHTRPFWASSTIARQIDDQGRGTISEHRMYQLIRQSGSIANRRFEIEFLDPGVEFFSFTFG